MRFRTAGESMAGYPANRDLVHHRQNKALNVQPIPSIYLAGHEKPSIILFRNLDLFLAQKIEVGVTAGTRIDDGGKVPGKIVGVTAA